MTSAPARTKRRPSGKTLEAAIQRDIVNYIRTVLPAAVVLHIHNNGHNRNDQIKLRRMGLVAGAPDLLVCLPRGAGLFFEVKAPGGYASRVQRAFHMKLQPLEWPCAIVRSIDDVRNAFATLNIKTREVI
jgi:hypothetical protein